MKIYLPVLFVISLTACHSNDKRDLAGVKPSLLKSNTTTAQKKTLHQKEIMEFVAYNDDSDYFLLIAQKNKATRYFIHDGNDKSLAKGDSIEVFWKTDTVYAAGNGETPSTAARVISLKKISEGNVSKFRANYGKALKYYWSADEKYSKSYLDKLYSVVEYYIANSNNELLLLHIGKKDNLVYSIEQQVWKGKAYTLLGIATETEHRTNTMQWLYYQDENNTLFEYDLANNSLKAFK